MASFACEDCGRKDRQLEIHHCFYVRGWLLWEYESDLMMCVCGDCHEIRQKLEDAIHVALAKIMRHLKPGQLEKEAWNIVQELANRETARLAEAFQ